MREPVTTLDTRFSEPGATAMAWDDTVRVLETAELSWIATVRADGRPHVTPLVAVWLDGAAYFTTGSTEQKAANLAANPQVILTTGCNTWDRGADVVVEGVAERVGDDALLTRLAALWAQKWDGRWRYEARDGALHHQGGGAALVFEVVPSKVLAFGKGEFSQTRHRFPEPGATSASSP